MLCPEFTPSPRVLLSKVNVGKPDTTVRVLILAGTSLGFDRLVMLRRHSNEDGQAANTTRISRDKTQVEGGTHVPIPGKEALLVDPISRWSFYKAKFGRSLIREDSNVIISRWEYVIVMNWREISYQN